MNSDFNIGALLGGLMGIMVGMMIAVYLDEHLCCPGDEIVERDGRVVVCSPRGWK